uniref:Sulfatase N-terminal domain-containing protein n=1 Tax=Lepeophtheirus salmonis TaxID=72036 RepID=A0A0K2TUT6_LEPSM
MFRIYVFILVCLIWRPVESLKKNVLLMIADDLGMESGIYGNGKIVTPNIDALGKQSCVFDEAFTSVSSCSPSRSTILTGYPSHQNGMYGLHNSIHHFNSLDSVLSLPKLLTEHGFSTGIIGKKHVGPDFVYPFNFSHTEENHSMMQVGRNITLMKKLAGDFLQKRRTDDKPFFLYLGFHDPHRCGHTHPKYGSFCEKFGRNGSIPDWTPIDYNPNDIVLPFYIQDTYQARKDIADLYATISRLDQGIGLIIKLLKDHDFWKDTLIIFSSDNGIPFANGRTNFYDSGIKEPLFISTPEFRKKGIIGKRSSVLSSLLDIVPTILSWLKIKLPKQELKLTGRSLLHALEDDSKMKRNSIFGSHNLHEVTMYYPMRYLRTKRYKLIHNMNSPSPFPIDQDLYLSPSFQDILNRTRFRQDLHWFKDLKSYYYRPEWELYDLKHDPFELENKASTLNYKEKFLKLKKKLVQWQKMTFDPWLCSPHSVYESIKSEPNFKSKCYSLLN